MSSVENVKATEKEPLAEHFLTEKIVQIWELFSFKKECEIRYQGATSTSFYSAQALWSEVHVI